MRPVALVTGPTSGLGAGFAKKYASLGYDLVLVARDEVRLHDLASELKTMFGTESEILVADLASEAGRDTVALRLEKGVEVLVNNADSVPPASSGPPIRRSFSLNSTSTSPP